ncbi:MAG: hypothetical protein ACOYL6_07170 [Bacteriovoracaceae bacterium]
MRLVYFLILFHLISSWSTHAALKEKFNISDAQYSARIKPYLQSLNNDFYELFLQFRPELSAIKEVSKNNIKIKRELKYMEKACKGKVLSLCQASLQNLELIALANHNLIQELKGKDYCHKSAMKKCAFAIEVMKDLYLVSLRTKNNLSLATLWPYKKTNAVTISWVQIEKDLSEMNSLTQSFIAQSFPDANNQDLQLIWGTFFKEIEDLMLVSNDAKLFRAWVDRLNFAVNEFHLSLSNKAKTIPNGLLLKAETMHGKWNSMLREHL